jgi:hypothetical protein
MTLQETRTKRKEAAADLEALYGDLDKMRQLHAKHTAAESKAKGQVRNGKLELEELVRVQSMRQSVAGIIAELEGEITEAEAQLSALEEQADTEAKHERLASAAAVLTDARSKHEAAMLDLRNTLKERLEPILELELAWREQYERGLKALQDLGFSGEASPNASTRAKDAALLAEAEGRGVDLPALLEPRYANAFEPWAAKPYQLPLEAKATGFELELIHAIKKTIEAARRERYQPQAERTTHEVVAV